jgi:hypothetical protein
LSVINPSTVKFEIPANIKEREHTKEFIFTNTTARERKSPQVSNLGGRFQRAIKCYLATCRSAGKVIAWNMDLNQILKSLYDPDVHLYSTQHCNRLQTLVHKTAYTYIFLITEG